MFDLSESDESDNDLLSQLPEWDREERQRLAGSHLTFRRLNYMQTLSDADFSLRFRLSKPAVDSLLVQLIPHIRVTSKRNHGVSPLHQLLLTLRFYALGTMLISVADFIGVSASTAGRIVGDVSSAIANLYDEHVVMHQQSAVNFYRIARFPRVLGLLDCTHIRIQSPSQQIGDQFRNSKGYFSLNVQAVCDADLKFMNLDVRWPGSTHDATIFDNSILKAQCDAKQFGNRWLLGHSAYPNRSYLLTPISNPVNEPEERYNAAHFKTRSTIERCLSIWKRRFPVVASTLRISLPKAQAIIIATAVLHNICKQYNMEELPSEVDLPPEVNSSSEATEYNILYDQVQDFEDRNILIENFFS